MSVFHQETFMPFDTLKTQVRYYQIAGITVEVTSDLPIRDDTFEAKFAPFAVDEPGEDPVRLHHHFGLPPAAQAPPGVEVLRNPPWVFYRHEGRLLYQGILPYDHSQVFDYAEFDERHTRGDIYHPNADLYQRGNWHALSMFATDQIWLAQALSYRQACYLHSGAVAMQGQGLLFLGHSGAGKSTTLTMLRPHAELLCDDRNIVRRWPDGFRVHGTWSHGDLPECAPTAAPLRALLFIEQAPTNALIPIDSPREVLRRLLLLVIKSAVSADWWERTLDVLEPLSREVPAYRMQLDTSGKMVDCLQELCSGAYA